MPIERRTLRAQVRDELLERMRNGDVQPGEGVNEVVLAAELGVSRTPLREALIALETEGQVERVDGKGFRFRPFSYTELRELAPILAVLEGFAIELIPLDRLQQVGTMLGGAAAEFNQSLVQHSLVIAKDDEWHGVMVADCPNKQLLGMIASTRRVIHRYESILVPEDAIIDRVAAEHTLIAQRLAAGDVPGAQAGLRANWVNGVERIIANAERKAPIIPSPPLREDQQ